MKFLPVFLLMIGLLSACQSSTNNTSEDTTTNSTEAVNPSANATQETAAIQFLCEVIPGDLPEHLVYLVAGDQKEELAQINTCQIIERDKYSEYKIPANAIAAVGGWFAGSGDYMYAIEENNKTTIFYGGVSEMQLTSYFGYQVIATVENDVISKIEGPSHPIDQVLGVYALGGHGSSWLMIVDHDGVKWDVTFKEIDGMLPGLEDLPTMIGGLKLEAVADFVFNPDSKSFTSSIGSGAFEEREGELTVVIKEKSSHIDDQLRMERIGI